MNQTRFVRCDCLIVKNARIVSSKGITEADILIEGEWIKKIAKSRMNEKGEEVIDASGLLALPGLIDAHVHLRDPGATHKEDFYTGTCAALAGGVTTVLDMPNNNPPTTTVKALKEKQGIALEKAVCDFDFHFGAETNNFNEIMKASPRSLKMFLGSTTGNLLTENAQEILEHFKKFPQNKPICIHAEDEERIRFMKTLVEQPDATNHNEIRDETCALLAVQKALELLAKHSRQAHFCHVTTASEVTLIRARKLKNVSCEVTPHHLFLSEKTAERIGNYAKMNPPLRSEKTRAELWQKLGEIDVIATDHAPHAISEKEKEYSDAPAGVPGLETMLPLLLNAVNERKLRIERVVEMCCANPARVFHLKNKGEIAVGKHADLTLIDLKKTHKLGGERLYTKCGWTPFEGTHVQGRVEKTILRGQLAYEENAIYVKKGTGKKVE